MKKVGLADWRTSNGLPSASDPETEADRTPRGSLLACMTANREPSNQSFEIDREATVCTASRRFLPFERTPPLPKPNRRQICAEHTISLQRECIDVGQQGED